MVDTRTGLARVKTGGKSYTALARQYIPGVSGVVGAPSARNIFAPVRSNAMRPTKGRYKERVQSNTRFTERSNVGGMVTAAGPVQWLLNPILFTELIEGLLGAKGSVITPVAATAAVGAATTTNGTTLIPWTGAVNPGEALDINTGVNMERVHVIDYSAGALVVPQLKIVANQTAVNLPVAIAGGFWLANSLLPSSNDDDLMRFSVERVMSGKWGYLFWDVLIEKLVIDLAPGFTVATADAYTTADFDYVYKGDLVKPLTAYTPNAAEEKRALQAFVARDAFLCLPDDPEGTGASLLRSAIGVRTGKVTYDNGLDKFEVQGANSMNAAPGDNTSMMFEYNELDTAWRPHIWQDYMATDVEATMQIGWRKNYGTPGTPNNGSMAIRMDNMLYENSVDDEGLTKLTAFAHTASAKIDPAKSNDMMRVFVSPPS